MLEGSDNIFFIVTNGYTFEHEDTEAKFLVPDWGLWSTIYGIELRTGAPAYVAWRPVRQP
jgi:hypothetical protein